MAAVMDKTANNLEVYVSMLDLAKSKRAERDAYNTHVRQAMLKGVDYRPYYDNQLEAQAQLEGMVLMIAHASGVEVGVVYQIVDPI